MRPIYFHIFSYIRLGDARFCIFCPFFCAYLRIKIQFHRFSRMFNSNLLICSEGEGKSDFFLLQNNILSISTERTFF